MKNDGRNSPHARNWDALRRQHAQRLAATDRQDKSDHNHEKKRTNDHMDATNDQVDTANNGHKRKRAVG